MKRKSLLAFVTLILGLSGQKAIAQSTMMNAPSTDVVVAKKVYLEMDFITNYAWAQGDDRFANYLPRAVVGVGRNVEVGVNVSYTRVPGGGEPIEIQPNAKWQFYNNEAKGVAAAAGCMFFVPITHRAGTDTFAQCYSVASKQFSGNYGPRFTGGGYRLIGAGAGEETKTGVVAGYEQPLTQRLSFIVDWASGNNRFGYISPALNLSTPRNGNLSGGYAIANQGRGRNWLFFFYGQQF
ncbi:MAG: hypothetical protein ACT4OT_07150 [Acidobacteriota bacterium]